MYHLVYVRGVYKLAVTDMLRLPKWWTGIAVPLGFGLSLIYALYFFVKDRLHQGGAGNKMENAGEGGTNG